MNKNTLGYIAIIIMLVAASIFSINLFLHGKEASDRLDIHKFPHVVDGWEGKDLAITEKEYDILETRNLIAREYTAPSGAKLELFIIYSETNRSVFHPPEVCLIGSGITTVDKKTEEIASDKGSFLTNKLYLEKGPMKELMLYSYKAGNLYTENFYLQQLYLMAHQVFGKRVPGATIRVSMQVVGSDAETLATLKKFLADTVKIVDGLS